MGDSGHHEIDYRKQVLDNWGLVNRLAARRFSRTLVAEEAALFVMERLEQNDWERLRLFNGTARFTTYFASVVYRLLEDFSRKRYGRKRPPQWLRDAGGAWVLLYRLLCLERYSYVDAVEIASDRRNDIQPDKIQQIAGAILGRIPQCGQRQDETEFSENHQLLPSLEDDVSDQHKKLESKQKTLLAGALFSELLGESASEEQEVVVKRLLAGKVVLSPEERLLLKLCHRDGMTVARAGKLVGLNRFQAHGKMRRLYKRIRRCFEEAGYGEEMRQLLKE